MYLKRAVAVVVAALVALLALTACSDGEAAGGDDLNGGPTAATPTPATGGPDPLWVETLVGSDLEGELFVVGYIVIDSSGARFCGALLESFPPQCGGLSVEIAGYEVVGLQFQEAQGVRWTETAVPLWGEYSGGVFAVDRRG